MFTEGEHNYHCIIIGNKYIKTCLIITTILTTNTHMGTNLTKYAADGLTNMSKELNIEINLIVSARWMEFVDYQYVYYDLDVELIKEAINSMNSCKYIQTNFVYNTKNRILLNLVGGDSIILALSDCNTYIGVPTRASGMGLWFYLLNGDIKYNPFVNLRSHV